MKRTIFALAIALGLATSFVVTPMVMAQQGNTAIIKQATVSVDEQAITAEDMRDISTFAVSVKNAGTYQLEFEASFDGGATWVATYGAANDAVGTRAASTTAAGQWFFANQGYSRFRVRASAYTSGTPLVFILRGYAKAVTVCTEAP